MSRARIVLGLLGLAASLAGCADRLDAPLSPTFGQAYASMESQIIDPAVAPGIPETSGATAAAAVQRYEKGEVKALETKSSSALGGKQTNTNSGGTTSGDKK